MTTNIALMVNAESLDRVKAILAYVLDIKSHKSTTVREIKGFYVVEVEVDDVNLDDFYKRILGSQEIAIVADPGSFKICSQVAEEIYPVETQLRRLLLHVSDLVATFYDILKDTSKFAKPMAERHEIINDKQLDPLTSKLTLGEMIEILKFNLSQRNEPLTMGKFEELLENSKDLKSLQDKVVMDNEDKLIWDIISEHVLDKSVPWSSIASALNKLKSLRDKAAHFNILTKVDLEEAKKQAKHIMENVKEKKLTPKEQGDLKTESVALAGSIARGFQIPTGFYQQLIDAQSIATSVVSATQPSWLAFQQTMRGIQGDSGLQKYLRDILNNEEDDEPNPSVGAPVKK